MKKKIIRACIVLLFFLLSYSYLYVEQKHFLLWHNQVENNRVTVDNYASVNEYQYKGKKSKENNVILLKDCNYSFWEELHIPGMPETREADLLNNIIFSESQCPQGICMTDEYFLLTSYSEGDDIMGELMVFDKTTGEYVVTLAMDAESHLGGIAFDGMNIWVCNSNENTIERLSYDFVKLMATENLGEVVDASAVVDEYEVKNKPSCITYHNGRLWIATHKVYVNSTMVAYHYNSTQNELELLSSYQIPSRVQGVAFTEENRVYLSTSYGRTNSSYLKEYSSVADMATNPGKPDLQVEMPPGSEEVDYLEGQIMVIFESAGEKYYNGTDGLGQSLSPIDKILLIDEASLLDESK